MENTEKVIHFDSPDMCNIIPDDDRCNLWKAWINCDFW